MSDKFFFKGRQDSRQHHTELGFETDPKHKLGTQKFPMTLVVTSAERQQELEAQLLEAKLFANITVDSSDGAVESIAEFTAILNKAQTVKVEKTPARNEPCSCGSGKKFKKCCG